MAQNCQADSPCWPGYLDLYLTRYAWLELFLWIKVGGNTRKYIAVAHSARDEYLDPLGQACSVEMQESPRRLEESMFVSDVYLVKNREEIILCHVPSLIWLNTIDYFPNGIEDDVRDVLHLPLEPSIVSFKNKRKARSPLRFVSILARQIFWKNRERKDELVEGGSQLVGELANQYPEIEKRRKLGL